MDEDVIKILENAYFNLITPNRLIQLLNSNEKFIEWLDDGTLQDLQYTLEAFEEDELYEYCEVIKQVMDRKKLN